MRRIVQACCIAVGAIVAAGVRLDDDRGDARTEISSGDGLSADDHPGALARQSIASAESGRPGRAAVSSLRQADAGESTTTQPPDSTSDAPEDVIVDAPDNLGDEGTNNTNVSDGSPAKGQAMAAGAAALKALTAESISPLLQSHLSSLDPLTGANETGCGEKLTIETSDGCSVGIPACPPGWTSEGTRYECCRKGGWWSPCLTWAYYRKCTRCENDIKGTSLFYKRGQFTRSFGVGFTQGNYLFLLDSIEGLKNITVSSLGLEGEGHVMKGNMNLSVPVNMLGRYNISTLTSADMRWSTMPKPFSASASVTLFMAFTLEVSADDLGRSSPTSSVANFAITPVGGNGTTGGAHVTCKGECRYATGGPPRCRTDTAGEWASCLGKVEFDFTDFTVGLSDITVDLGLPKVYAHLFDQVANTFVSDMKVNLVDFVGQMIKKRLADTVLAGLSSAIGGNLGNATAALAA